ncbi:MAG: hypothetical protein ACRCUM_00275, partial [Mycoplasmoidaceae bacterium]
NFIIIDLWNFFDSENIIEEINDYLFLILCSNNEKYKNLAKEKINNLSKSILEPIINNFFGIAIKMHKDDISKSIEDINYFPKSIIVFDNLERMGKKSWEIIKLIQKLSRIKNFVFILTMDVDKINNNSNGFEKGIEKFIDLPSYNLKQDYTSLLISLGFNKETSSEIDKLLKIDIGKKQFSIRELRKIMLNNLIYKEYINMSKLRNIFSLRNKIWKIENKDLFDFCENDFIKFTSFLFDIASNVRNMIESLKSIFIVYDKFSEIDYFLHDLEYIFLASNNILEKNYKIFFDDNVKSFIKQNLNISDNEFKLYHMEYSNHIIMIYSEKCNELFNLFKEIKKELENKISDLSMKIKENKINISKKIKRIEGYKKKIKKENDSEDTIHNKIINLEESIKRELRSSNKIEEDNSSMEKKINISKDLLNKIDILSNDFLSINKVFAKYISDINNLYEKNLQEEYEFEKIEYFFFNFKKNFELVINASDFNNFSEKIINFFIENFNEFVETF